MNVVLRISLRNLFRQKRRNILLGTAIAVGVMILVIANSFSRGISDILFNKIVVYVAGHVQISFNERSQMYKTIFRDKDRIIPIIKNNVPELRAIDEAIGVFTRAIGNGKADNLILVGIDTKQTYDAKLKKEYEETFRMLEGRFEDLDKEGIENPAIISEEKAKYLNVKMNDIIRIRFTTIHGQNQAVKLNIVGIVKNDNVFMQGVMYVSLINAKDVLAKNRGELALLDWRYQ